MSPVKDEYVNQAYLSVTETALNTLTFSKIETGISIYEKVAWVISRVDYFVTLPAGDYGAEGDALFYGLSAVDALAAVNMAQSAIIDVNYIVRRDYGAAATAVMVRNPHSKTFADLPGGGLLVPPNPLYIFAEGTGLVNPQTVEARMFYTVKSLKPEEFWELVEQRRMIGA